MSTNIKGRTSPIRNFFTFEKGSVKIIFTLVIPVLCELFLSSLFGMVDHMMAGWHSLHALNAIGLFNSPSALLVVFFTAINTGTSTRVAWNIGAKKISTARRVMRTSIILNVFIGILITVVSLITAPYIISFVASAEYGSVWVKGTVASDGVDVFRICALGFVFTGVTSSITATLRGAGENRAPLFYNMISNFLNVIGNFVLIFGIESLGIPSFGAQGAAISTAASRFIAMLLAIGFLMFSKTSKFSRHTKDFAVDFCDDSEVQKKPRFLLPEADISKKILQIGIPSMFESLIMQLGMLLFIKLVISTGPDSYAAHQITSNVNSMFLTFATGFSSATSTLVGQNIGAKNLDGAKYYTKAICKISGIISLGAAIIVWLLADKLPYLYVTDHVESAATVAIAAKLIYVCGFSIICTTIQSCLSGAIKGAGDTKFSLYTAIVCVIIIRVIITYVVVEIFHQGIVAIWLVILFDQLIRMIAIYIRYKSGRWEKYSKKALD